MEAALAPFLVVHGEAHVLAAVGACGLAQRLQLTPPSGRAAGGLWLLAGLAMVTAAALLVLLVRVAGAFLRARSLRALYAREVERAVGRRAPAAPVTEADLAPLPPAVQVYLRRAGVVGRARVHDVRVRWRGQMRNGKGSPWMKVRADQVEIFDPPTRLFYMRASRRGVPFEALHVYAGASATMRVRVASLLDVVDARGPEMNRSETVTFFNDMCVLAPASLLDANVRWQPVDARRVRGTFTNAGNTISAELTFDTDGDLVDFVSEDRSQSSDGKAFRRLPWSTPLRDYRDFRGARVAARGDAVWREPDGDFVYARFEVEDIALDVAAPRDPSRVGPARTPAAAPTAAVR